eukprot:Opistho-2@6955
MSRFSAWSTPSPISRIRSARARRRAGSRDAGSSSTPSPRSCCTACWCCTSQAVSTTACGGCHEMEGAGLPAPDDRLDRRRRPDRRHGLSPGLGRRPSLGARRASGRAVGQACLSVRQVRDLPRANTGRAGNRVHFVSCDRCRDAGAPVDGLSRYHRHLRRVPCRARGRCAADRHGSRYPEGDRPSQRRVRPRLFQLPQQSQPAPRPVRRGMCDVPPDHQLESCGLSASVAKLDRMRAMPPGATQPLHAPLPHDFHDGGAAATRAGRAVLPVPSDRCLERHSRRRLVQAPLAGFGSEARDQSNQACTVLTACARIAEETVGRQ